MAELLKNKYTKAFISSFGELVHAYSPQFNVQEFSSEVFCGDWEQLELKGRMRRIASVLGKKLSGKYGTKIKLILQLIEHLEQEGSTEISIEYMFLPDFVEVYGLDDLEISVNAMERITQFSSCEFCVRPFLIKYPRKMLQQMLQWAEHPHPLVRRLATEGTRPRLPWAMALPAFKNTPKPILPILDLLKDDEAETVRRSVANNVNDIAKDNPEIAIELIQRWHGKTETLNWVAKHAARTLLKQGNSELLQVFGYGNPKEIQIAHFQLSTYIVKFGSYLEFNFELKNTGQKTNKVRLEYAVYYQKANGSLSKKVYKISEREYAPFETNKIARRQAFKPINTRKFHAGLHQIALVVNGLELEKHSFKLEI